MAITQFAKKRPNAEATQQAQDDAPEFEKVDWMKDPGLRQLYFYAFILCIASATTGYDGMFFNNVQNFQSWKDFFGNPQGQMLGLLGALYQIGSLASMPVVPILADRFGRKLPIAIGCVLMIVAAFLQGFSQNLGTFMGARFLIGFGNSLAQLCSPMLLTELCHPQHRGRLTAVYNCLWNVGAFVVSIICFGTDFMKNEWSWRIPAILQAFPSVIQIVFIWWVPESPRFLIAKDKHEEALHILAKYHANGNENHPTVQFEYREIRETIKLELGYAVSSSYMDFFKTKGNRWRLAVLISLGIFSQWSGNAIISNYTGKLYNMAGIENTSTIFGLNSGSTIMSLFTSVAMALMVDRFGRRPLFLVSTASMFSIFIFWTLTGGLYGEHNAPGANHAMIFFIWLFQVAYSIAWSGLLVAYAIEILPYKLRAKGILIMNVSVQAALTLNIYANPIAFEAFGMNGSWKLYLIYTCWIFAELCFVYFMYVETKGPTLEELAKIIDGEDAQVAQINLQQVEKEAAIQNEITEVEPERKA